MVDSDHECKKNCPGCLREKAEQEYWKKGIEVVEQFESWFAEMKRRLAVEKPAS